MAVLPIVIGRDQPILRTKTKRVLNVTKDVLRFIRDMQETLKSADGVGLAAPQVGQSLRLCLATIEGVTTVLINPEIISKSPATELDEEGCLSLPGVWLPVPRAVDIIVRFQNEKGKMEERKLSHFSARVIQHEVDHLEGVLIVDYQRKNVL